jgi:beta-lactamase regulating signal transducer with metallopeptidase domain
MISLFAQAPSSLFNPEAIINAAIAAKAAELAANQAFYMSLAIFVVLLIIGAAIMFTAYKFAELEHNTNEMRIQLVEATRKLGLAEGNVTGRAELTEETSKKERTIEQP